MFAAHLQSWLYAHIAKPIFFRVDPEVTHDLAISLGEQLGRYRLTRASISALCACRDPILEQNILGIHFPNPIGLAAGFDKGARLTRIIPAVGFGFMEIGSVTGEPCAGNPKPRLWRLPRTEGLVVYFGLKSEGCDAIAGRLRAAHPIIPLGVSVAKANSPAMTDDERGIADYVRAFRTLHALTDYVTINISCPNIYGGEPFTDPERLGRLLVAIDAIGSSKPFFLKLPADISIAELDALIAVANRHRISGFIASNLTKRRDAPTIRQDELACVGSGGISGRPVAPLANKLIAHLYQTVGDRYVIIGCGGIFSAEDAYEKIRLGASLVQLITGMIFRGPQLIGEINRGLARLLRRDGFRNINEAIGSAHRGGVA
ncbi:MAG: quinone-dependent dihydroorotate dehydrogenase [Candidatus Uhrbacteria bacterium]